MTVVRKSRVVDPRWDGTALQRCRTALVCLTVRLQQELRRALERRAVSERGRPAIPNVPRIVVSEWNPGLCFMATRFYPEEIIELHLLTGFPPLIKVDNGCVEEGVTALAMLMARLALPSRHFDLCWVFGRERSILGRITRYSQHWLYTNWGHLLKWSSQRLDPDRLEVIAASLVKEKNCPLSNCVGYIDGISS